MRRALLGACLAALVITFIANAVLAESKASIDGGIVPLPVEIGVAGAIA